MKLIIGNKNYSSWSLRPWLLMAYHGLDFETVLIPLYSAEMPALMAKYCPSKKVPTLHDGALIVSDSLAICEYISEKYLSNNGWPSDIETRAKARALAAEMHSGFFQIRTQMPMDIREKHKTYDASDNALFAEIARIDAIWSQAVDDEFLCGSFGIADCMFAPVAFRFQTYDVALSAPAKRYQKALLALPAMQAWQDAALLETMIIKNLNI
ncbi:glutathione S-transferase family protein [Ostreibacterium oceani]|uniref:Glutathione S-transferase n=1 Tax=Ostreibacterium oceani TaxID=2654998 RepID=A0A6N7F1X9_9GAMM|nr:glutathione S-transferase family protein [Ostreibacterium oceani]MPV86798.1 glutathione S-transferase [Ostreibacterium oceani]